MNSPYRRGRLASRSSRLKTRITALAQRSALTAVLGASALSASATDLQDVQFAALPGSQVEIQLNLSGPVPTPESFATESPARIAMDLPGVTSKLANKSVPIGVGAVHSLVAVEASDRTRVVLNLTDPVPYEVSSSGNRITIKVDTQGKVAVAPPPPPPPAQPVQSTQPASTPTHGSPGKPRQRRSRPPGVIRRARHAPPQPGRGCATSIFGAAPAARGAS